MPLEPTARRALGLTVIAALVALATALGVHWPWLRAEHARLTPVLAAGLWAADGLALAGLLWVGLWYAALGRPAPPARSRLALAAAVAAALAVDLVSAVAVAHDEVAGWDRSVAVPGEIVGGRPTANGQKAYLMCRFQSPDGAWHQGELQVRLSDQPPAIRAAVAGGQFPIPVTVRYDPEWPPRCWLDGFYNEEDNRLQWMSLVFLLFQVLGVPVMFVCARGRGGPGLVVWAQAVPALAELVPFALVAAAKFGEGEF